MTVIEGRESELLRDLLLDKRDARCDLLTGKIDPKSIRIPLPESENNTGHYRMHPVETALSESSLASLKVPDWYRDGAINHPYYRENCPVGPTEVLVRETLADILEGESGLRKFLAQHFGVELSYRNGYRALFTQDWIFERFKLAGRSIGSAQGLEGDELLQFEHTYALNFASAAPTEVSPKDPTTWYSHVTGCAIDMVVLDPNNL
ncbi:MAG: hypothetical protein KDD53_12805, partial [Bdellovibrionales bacterium]|nr:hypothetical protein [Bdellovibrionales bacterium]